MCVFGIGSFFFLFFYSILKRRSRGEALFFVIIFSIFLFSPRFFLVLLSTQKSSRSLCGLGGDDRRQGGDLFEGDAETSE